MDENLTPIVKGNDSSKKDESNNKTFLILFVVLIAILLILTFGWFYRASAKDNGREDDKETKKKKKKQRLSEIEASIKLLQAKKEKIERTEKNIKLSIRIGIGALLVWSNYWYITYNRITFDFECISGKLFNFNACILSVYSFIAFISYGSIENFVRRMKDILAGMLRKSHIDSLEELDLLLKERERLINEIDALENE